MEVIKDGYLRVTTPLSTYSNFSNIDPVVLNNAAQRGTKVHRYVEMYAKDEFFPTPDKELRGYITSFTEWFDEMVVEVVSTEQRFYSQKYKLTGAIDLIAKLKGSDELVIIDYKTPLNKSKTWDLQTAAYQMLVEETGLKPARRLAVMLRKNGSSAKIVEYTDYDHDWRLYKGILEAYRYFNA